MEDNQNKYVITLIGADHVTLTNDILDKLYRKLDSVNMQADTAKWLCEGKAADIEVDTGGSSIALPMLDEPVDIILQPSAGRKKRLLISDMDSTMIEQECIDELADAIGIKEKVAHITELAMNGELDFESALTERVALLEGLPADKLQEVFDSHISLMPGSKTLVTTMKAHGAKAVLVSGGFTFFTKAVSDQLGFDEHRANELDMNDDVLSGKVILPILGKEAKQAYLHEFAENYGMSLDQTLAVGDGANDLPMLQAAGLGVAYHAKPNVQKQVSCCINHSDLSSLLYIQGYHKDEFL